MKSLLADTKYLIPKVQLKNAECSTLVEKAEVLIAAQESFWTLYKTWIQQRVHTNFYDGHGMKKLPVKFLGKEDYCIWGLRTIAFGDYCTISPGSQVVGSQAIG